MLECGSRHYIEGIEPRSNGSELALGTRGTGRLDSAVSLNRCIEKLEDQVQTGSISN